MVSVDAGGVFGSLSGGEIRNLELIDTKVMLASGDAGALAGTLTGTTVSNVVAYHNDGKEDTAKITTDSGDAGGLIGSIEGTTSVTKSAAALIVSSTSGNAGGLIGTASGGTVSGCYSGGHTENSTINNAVIYDSESYNVTASGTAGGLIGDAGAAAITNCYSTCSVTGKFVGGFVGKGDSDGSATNCYATGLVLGGNTTTKSVTGEDGTQTTVITFEENQTQEGAFAYSFSGTATNCNYFEIINERKEKEDTGAATGGYTYLTALPSGDSGITPFDESAATFNEFCGSDWSDAMPYNTTLKDYYGEGTDDAKYILKSVEQLVGSLKSDDTDTTEYFVATHYGDWPAPEIFVVNTAS